MIKVEIKSTDIHTREVGKNTFREQQAWAYIVYNGKQNDYPAEIKVNLTKGQSAYDIGFYTVAPESLYVGEFKKLSIGRLQLLPLRPSAAVKTA